jgi:hypothetical protein
MQDMVCYLRQIGMLAAVADLLAVVGATVPAMEQETGLSARSVTADAGQFHFFCAPAGLHLMKLHL